MPSGDQFSTGKGEPSAPSSGAAEGPGAATARPPSRHLAGRDIVAPDGEIHGPVVTHPRDVYIYPPQEYPEPATEAEEPTPQPIEDPTSPFKPRTSSFEHENLNLWIRKIRKKRFLILHSDDPEVLANAGYAVGHRLAVKEWRVLRFDGENREDSDPQLAILRDGTIETASPSFVMVMANVSQSRGFVGSMPTEDSTAIDHFTDSLEDLDRYVLVLGTRESLSLSEIYEDYREEVDLLWPRLKKHYPEDFESLHQKLLKQIDEGRWPTDPKDLLRQLSSTFRDGSLGREIARREQIPPGQDSEDGARIDAKPLLSSQDELKNTVLFVATFFTGLSALDFEEAVLCLLGDREMESQATLGSGADGQFWIEGRDETRPLREIWKEQHREVLDSCHLDFQQPTGPVLATEATTGPRVPVAEFTDAYLRQNLREVFWASAYKTYVDLLERVFAQRLFFEHSSEMVMEGVIRLIVDTAKVNPELHGQEWLLHLIPESALSGDCKATEQDDRKQDDRIRQAIDEIGKRRFYYRMKHLILEMVGHKELRGLVTSFLAKLIDLYVLRDARELLWRLRASDRIDVFSWWKRLLDRTHDKTTQAVCKNIADHASESEQRLVETLLRVGEWLPEPGRSGACGAERVAPVLITDLCLRMALGERQGSAAVWPPSNPVLKALEENQAEPVSGILFRGLASHDAAEFQERPWRGHALRFLRIRLLAREAIALWPGQEIAMANRILQRWARLLSPEPKDSATPQPDPYFPQALILADWALDLLAFEGKVPEQARARFEMLVASILATFDLRGRRALHRHWTIFTQLQKDLLLELTRQADHLLTQDGTSPFQQIQSRLPREMGILRDLASQIFPFSEDTVSQPGRKPAASAPVDQAQTPPHAGPEVNPGAPKTAAPRTQKPDEATGKPESPSPEKLQRERRESTEPDRPEPTASPKQGPEPGPSQQAPDRDAAEPSQPATPPPPIPEPPKAWPAPVETATPPPPRPVSPPRPDDGSPEGWSITESPDSTPPTLRVLADLAPQPQKKKARLGLFAAFLVLALVAASFFMQRSETQEPSTQAQSSVSAPGAPDPNTLPDPPPPEGEMAAGGIEMKQSPLPEAGGPAPTPLPRPGDHERLRKQRQAQQLLAEGRQLQGQGQRTAARDAYARATRLAPRDAYAWANLGAAEIVLGNVASGERAYRRALQIDGDNWLARYNLGTHLARSGRRAEALEQLSRTVSTLRRLDETQHLADVRRDMASSSAFTELRDDARFHSLLGR